MQQNYTQNARASPHPREGGTITSSSSLSQVCHSRTGAGCKPREFVKRKYESNERPFPRHNPV